MSCRKDRVKLDDLWKFADYDEIEVPKSMDNDLKEQLRQNRLDLEIRGRDVKVEGLPMLPPSAVERRAQAMLDAMIVRIVAEEKSTGKPLGNDHPKMVALKKLFEVVGEARKITYALADMDLEKPRG